MIVLYSFIMLIVFFVAFMIHNKTNGFLRQIVEALMIVSTIFVLSSVVVILDRNDQVATKEDMVRMCIHGVILDEKVVCRFADGTTIFRVQE